MAKQKKDNKKGNSPQDSPPTLTVAVDFEEFAHFLEGSDLTEEEACRYLQTIWVIVCEFVSLGFGVHPAQQAQDSCGKDRRSSPTTAMAKSDGLNYRGRSLIMNFADATDLETDQAEKGVEA